MGRQAKCVQARDSKLIPIKNNNEKEGEKEMERKKLFAMCQQIKLSGK